VDILDLGDIGARYKNPSFADMTALSKSTCLIWKLLFRALAKARDGDMLCIILGCSVPVVVREHGGESGKWFELIGEAYVHGTMDGEAMEDGPEYTMFELRISIWHFFSVPKTHARDASFGNGKRSAPPSSWPAPEDAWPLLHSCHGFRASRLLGSKGLRSPWVSIVLERTRP
jgi:hypothetical protein